MASVLSESDMHNHSDRAGNNTHQQIAENNYDDSNQWKKANCDKKKFLAVIILFGQQRAQ